MPNNDILLFSAVLVFLFRSDAEIHAALGVQGSPVPQAATPALSAEAFKAWVISRFPDGYVHTVEGNAVIVHNMHDVEAGPIQVRVRCNACVL